jgi:arsenate reductase
MRLLILCTHNSARSQMGEGWLRYWSNKLGLQAEVFSAGTEATFVKSEAVEVMKEVGIDLSGHTSKILFDLPDPWNFDVVLTVCDSANETCPAYPAKTNRLHVSFPDPSGKSLEEWRKVRDALKWTLRYLVVDLLQGKIPSEEVLRNVVGLKEVGSSTGKGSSR